MGRKNIDEEVNTYNDQKVARLNKSTIRIIFLLVLILILVVVAYAIINSGQSQALFPNEQVQAVISEAVTVDMEETTGSAPINSEKDINGDESGISTGSDADEATPAEIADRTIGALDDQEDPQTGGMTGAGAGQAASVDVSTIDNGEINDETIGIDVSKYQGTIDWAKVKEAGVDFAMIRVGYRTKVGGVMIEDPTARYNMQEAQANGIKIGAYFFSAAVNEAEAVEEAQFTADIIAQYPITYPVAYNCEDFQSADSRQYGMDNIARTNLAIAFLDAIAEAGYSPMFYAAKSEMENNTLWDTDTLSARYKIWVAQYPAIPYPEAVNSDYSGSHDMWQYTSQGTVAGINNKTDINVAYFGYEETATAKDETPAERVEADVEVGIIFTEVEETVTAKQETNLRSEPSTNNDNSIVGRLVHGDTATRTGIGHNGWSRVIYNGQTLYAVSNYLTTDMNDTGQQAPPQGPIYTPVGDRVTAKETTNLRTGPSTADPGTIVVSITNGEVVTRIATGDNGWSQIDYNGQTLYAVTSYLQPAQ
ncbi:MAG: glycoside hydrolase family 25 [Lachnospiraceae bacterium]|jgi:GH25 family lysozyme M1 (1,4-beta-N-acetylmuramidase)|nr:glycoside hydrolase family 25 [Lachnospiraceae bacterium]